MGLTDAFLQEIDHEGKTTRRVLERVPVAGAVDLLDAHLP